MKTEKIYASDDPEELPDQINKILRHTWEDHGIGSYECHGMRGCQVQWCAVLDGPDKVAIDFTGWDGEIPSKIQGTLSVTHDYRGDQDIDWRADFLTYDPITKIGIYDLSND